jgi:hypothetical protein
MIFTKGAKQRWVEAQPEHVVALGKARAMQDARVRHPDQSIHDGDVSWLAAALDAERGAVAELDAAKAELREVRHRLEKQFDDAHPGRTDG